jgi:hypothetical protein
MPRKDGIAQLYAGLMVITDGYIVGPDCVVMALPTRLKKYQQAREKQMAGRLE